MSKVFIGLGSNLAHPRRQLARAIDSLARLPRTNVLAVSPNYLTEPIGTSTSQPDYVNAVAVLSTALAPRALLARLHAIEQDQRRQRHNALRGAPRTLDLDLLLFGRLRARLPHLAIPHPRMHTRAFVLRPLTDVAPAVVIPGHGAARRLLRNVASQRIARTRAHKGG